MNDTEPQSHAGPTIITRSGHNISRADISSNALKVLYRLRNSGHQAFLVGGGVRDLLLSRHPKDFDVATDAHPDEMRKLFRNCRLIGRRFRLAHVYFGREVIEVATFRSSSSGLKDDRQHSDNGRVIRDNVYGTIEEDIWRRDFTVNALYYNVTDFSIRDYTTGMADIKARTLRLIGEPETRYREDPVRMLRAARFAAKLDFHIADDSAAPIRELGDLLRDVPPARLYDETLKLFQSGHAVRSLEMLQEFDLLKYLFPHTARVLQSDKTGKTSRFIREGLQNTDRRVQAEEPVTPMFLYAILLWHPILELKERIRADEESSEIEALLDACDELVAEQLGHTSYPRRFSTPMKAMLVMQLRFENRRGGRAHRLLNHKQFRAAYDFLQLRARCGEADSELAEWWTDVQTLPTGEQRKAFSLKPNRSKRRRSSRRSPRQSKPQAAR